MPNVESASDPIDPAIDGDEPLYDGMTREQCVQACAKIITVNARQLRRRLNPSLKDTVRFEDLVQEGYIGVLDALDKYDPDEGVKFSTYAEFRILGTMLDYLRSLDPLSRTYRKHARELAAATRTLRHRLDRPPTSGEVAEASGLTDEGYAALRLDTFLPTFIPLDAPVPLHAPKGELHLVEKHPDPHAPLADMLLIRTEDHYMLRAAIARLPARLRCIVVRYYFLGQEQEEIGDYIGGVTPTRVYQLLKEALAKLKTLLQEPVCADDVPDETSFLSYGLATGLTLDFRRWVPVVAIPEAIDRFLTFYQIHRVYNRVLLSILVSSLGNPLPRSVLNGRFAAAFGEVEMTDTLRSGFKNALRDLERHLPGLIIIEAKATPQGGSVRLDQNQYQRYLDEMEAVSLPETSDIDRWSDDAALLLSSKKIKNPYARQILSVLRAAQGVTLPRFSFFEILASLNGQTPESVPLSKSITHARRRIVQALPGLLEEKFLPGRSDKPVLKTIRMDPKSFDRLASEARET